MQQATVNLFADMGLQADTLMTGLAAAAASTDTTAPDDDDHRARRRRRDRRRDARHGHRHRDRHRRHRRRRRGLDRRRRDLAPGHRHDLLDVQLDRPRRAARPRSWRGPSTTAATSRRAPPSATVDIALPVHDAGPERRRRGRSTPATQPGRGRRALQVRPQRHDQRHPLLQGGRQHRHPRRQAVADRRHAPRHAATFTGESASGWQQVTFQTPVDIDAGHDVRRLLLRAATATTRSPTYYFYQPSPVGGNTLDSPPLHAISANGGGGNGVFSYASSPTLPGAQRRRRPTTAVDVVFTPSLPPGTGRPASPRRPAPARRPSTSSPRRPAASPSRYIVTPFLGAAAQPPRHGRRAPRRRRRSYVSGLNAGSSYTFRVQAANAHGTSASRRRRTR